MAWYFSIGVLIGAILLVTVFKSQFKGQVGELASAYSLRGLDRDKYEIIHDIKLKNPKAQTKTSQIDHIIVSIYGIFVIETKGYKGKIYGDEFKRTWSQYLGNKSYKFLNPFFQNYGHIKALENILKDDFPHMKYFSIVAFSGEANIDDIKLKNSYICKIAYLEETIRALSKEEILSKEDMEKAKKLIKKNKSYQTDFGHKRDIKKLKKENKKKIAENICPRCGGDLIERKGKYGEFLGCSNFPKCRFTAKGA